MSSTIEIKGKHFIYTAQLIKGSKDKYIIRRGKNIDGEFIEYSNMFATDEDIKPKTFKSREDARAYLVTLAKVQDARKG